MTSPKLAKSTRSGRIYTHPLTQAEVPSVTTILGQIGKADALKWWAAGEVAKYAVANRATWENLDQQAAVDLLKREPLRSLDRAANRGTDVHSLAETLGNTGTLPEWADHLDGYVQALKKFWAEHQPIPVLVERTVFGDGYAGSFDLLCRLPIYGDDLVILDYKTSKAVYPDTAAQLAAYANAAEYHDSENNTMSKMPPVQRGVVIRLGGDGEYEMVEMHLYHGYELFLGALAVWQAQRNQLMVGKVINLPGSEQRELMRDEIRARVTNLAEHDAGLVEQLRLRWPVGVPTLAESSDHTAQQLSMVLSVLTEVERENDVPFAAVPTKAGQGQKKTKTPKPKKPKQPTPPDEANTPPNADAIELLRSSVESATAESRAAMRTTVEEALRAGFKMSLQQDPTWHRYLAAILVWSHVSNDATRRTLINTLEATGKTGTPGEIIAQLTYNEIERLVNGAKQQN